MDPKVFRIIMISFIVIVVMAAIINSAILIKRFHLFSFWGSKMQKAFLLTLWVGFGGFLGSIMRYWADFGMYSLLGERFPYGTLLVNIVGCYVIGVLGTLSAERALLNPSLRQFILIGIIGAFTTFSTFTYETLELFKERSFFMGSLNIGCHYFFCLLFVWLGSITSRLLWFWIGRVTYNYEKSGRGKAIKDLCGGEPPLQRHAPL